MVKQGDLVGGRYRLQERLGAGGMGAVWSAADTRLARIVAVKVMHQHLVLDAKGRFSERFHLECAATARLCHAGIPTVYDAGEHEDVLYLVMELVAGETLDEYVKPRYPLPATAVAAIGAQICTALAVAHDADLVHRDLKPKNVMITGGGQVKIMDFGIAAAEWQETKLTATGDVMGTVAYMAPEQFDLGAAEPRSDLYSLGCVLYEILTGKPMFTATTHFAMADMHIRAPVRPVREVAGGVPAELESAVMRLLEKEVDRRPADARAAFEMFRDLVGPEARAVPLPSDPRTPYLEPCAPPPRPVRVLIGRDRAGPRRKVRHAMSRDALAQQRQRAERQAQDGDLSGAVKSLTAALDAAVPAFGRVDVMVVAARLLRADLRFELGNTRDALAEYAELRPDAVRAHGEHSDAVAHIDAVLSEADDRGTQ